jgi:hypothetical protein
MTVRTRSTRAGVVIAVLLAVDAAGRTASSHEDSLLAGTSSLGGLRRSFVTGLSSMTKPGQASNETAALSLRATITSAADAGALTIRLSRWSTEAERAPLLAALAAPPPAPAGPAASGGHAGGRGRSGRGAPPPPPSPLARLSTAIKAAPTLGYIWTAGVTGYSIKYAWRSPAAGDQARIVLVTERRLDAPAPDRSPASGGDGDEDFTLIEMRIDRQGVGEGKTSLTTSVAIDTEAKTLALDGYAAAQPLLKVTR